MNPIQVKESIRVLLLTHQHISDAGGISLSSPYYLDFQEQQKNVLAMFNLPPTAYHKRLLFRYPFSCITYKKKFVAEIVADLQYSNLAGAYFLQGSIATGYGNDDFGFFSVVDKIEYTYWRLNRRSDELKRKGNH